MKTFGIHTPELTTKVVNILSELGFSPEDQSWANDETDSISLPNHHLKIWLPMGEDFPDFLLNSDGGEDESFESDLIQSFEKLDELIIRLEQIRFQYQKIALTFSDLLKDELGEDTLKEIMGKNQSTDDSTCDSHNHLDANMVMAEAFSEVMNREVDTTNIMDQIIWSLAWNAALFPQSTNFLTFIDIQRIKGELSEAEPMAPNQPEEVDGYVIHPQNVQRHPSGVRTQKVYISKNAENIGVIEAQLHNEDPRKKALNYVNLLENPALYKAELWDGDELCGTLEEKSSLSFDKWKYSRAVVVLKPKGRLLRFFINGEEQFMDDSKAVIKKK